ncbi:MAG: hypothetical protein JXM72_13160 [Deltaproteobacteria bacterium]|nr:hypothetical protein [Deltaproteobacteria bacterium]
MIKARFLSFPLNVRLGIIFTVGGWVFLILSSAVITSTIALMQITLALVCSVVIYARKPWARIFCMVINILIIANNMYALAAPSLADAQGAVPAAVHALNIALFTLATFFLMQREAASFYHGENP